MTETASQEPSQIPERLFEGELTRTSDGIYVSLTYDELDSNAQLNRVKSPKAGAVVLFAGM